MVDALRAADSLLGKDFPDLPDPDAVDDDPGVYRQWLRTSFRPWCDNAANTLRKVRETLPLGDRK